jgi:Domain of unknown function (DUF4262)
MPVNDHAEAIERHGYAIVQIAPDLDIEHARPGYAYTVGLRQRGLAELLIVGLPGATARMVLATLADHGLSQSALPMDIPLAGFFDGLEPVLRALDAAGAAAWMNPASPEAAMALHDNTTPPVGWSKARQIGGAMPGLQLLQVIWPDPCGHYPWEGEFDDALRPAQPLLPGLAPRP